MVLVPAAIAEIPVNGGLHTGCHAGDGTRANISALAIVFVGHDVVVLHRVQNFRPVEGGQVTEVRVLLDAHGPPRDVGQAVKADLFQLEHFEHDETVVKEEVVATDDGEVGEEIGETFQTVDAEEEQVVRDHDEFREAQATEVLQSGLEHKQDFQVALDNRAVLENAQIARVVADVRAGANCNEKDIKRSAFNGGKYSQALT